MPEDHPRPSPSDVTRLIGQLADGSDSAAEDLLPLVYQELRGQAAVCFQGRPGGQTLQPTALVHEAFLRLVGNTTIRWEGRSHFFSVAARAMRWVLADHAAARRAAKRGGDRQRLTLSGLGSDRDQRSYDALDIDAALDELTDWNERLARIVELRFFGGLTQAEVGQLLGLSERSVRNEWRLARAWLRKRLGAGELA